MAQTQDEYSITHAVLERNAGTPDERLKEIMTSLVRHLHDFARETQLTEGEWGAGIDFLTRVGQTCSARRQEFILLSDTLGLSMLVIAQNNRKPATCTESTVLGPFHVDAAPIFDNGADIANGAEGVPCFVHGKILSMDGKPIANASLDVWQADETGMYDMQYQQTQTRARGILHSDANGCYRFWSILASSYPIPDDGPVGKLLTALGRHPWRPAHLHFKIQAPGFQTLVTHVFRKGDAYLDSDAVFGVRRSLIAEWVEHDAGVAPDGSQQSGPYYTLNYDFVLAPEAVAER